MIDRDRLLYAAAGLAIALTAGVVSVAAAQEPSAAAEPEQPTAAEPVQFETYQLVLLVRPAHPTEMSDDQLEEIQRRHIAHLTELAEAGKIVIAGPFGDQEDERLRGLALYRVGSVEEARRLASQDPAVEAGRLEVEAMTWYVEKGYMTFPKAPPPSEPEPEPPSEPEPPPAAPSPTSTTGC